MGNLSKEVFINSINALQQQTAIDKQHAHVLSEMHQCDAGLYNNNLLKTTIINLLQAEFPPIDGYCDIEHYCWDLNFGKAGEQEVITPEDLYEQLVKLHLHKEHFLIKSGPIFMDNPHAELSMPSTESLQRKSLAEGLTPEEDLNDKPKYGNE